MRHRSFVWVSAVLVRAGKNFPTYDEFVLGETPEETQAEDFKTEFEELTRGDR